VEKAFSPSRRKFAVGFEAAAAIVRRTSRFLLSKRGGRRVSCWLSGLFFASRKLFSKTC
jgi:hypothetical protein